MSESNLWDLAKREWELDCVNYVSKPETCLCGHFPIKEVCTIKNKENSNYTTVGNCCVKKFLKMETGNIFAPIKRVLADETKSVSVDLIIYARKKLIISKWEHDFYINIQRKRKLSYKQKYYKVQINRKIVQAVAR